MVLVRSERRLEKIRAAPRGPARLQTSPVDPTGQSKKRLTFAFSSPIILEQNSGELFDLTPHRNYEIRCPVHGFVLLNDWEMGIVREPAFQRLRRIRQLAWTDQVYPGAMHTRFEHSLGVMHTASLLYDSIVRNSSDVLRG